MPGLQVPYEELEQPDMIVDGSALDANIEAIKVVETLKTRGWIAF